MVDSDDLKIDGYKESDQEKLDKERLSLKSKLSADIEQFLNSGGQITQVERDLRADPPKRPSMSYGTAPI